MSAQQALALPLPAASNTVVINARCSLRVEADQRVIVVAGLPVHHYRAEDAVAEAYAMVFLVESGFAQQMDVARAFGRSVRTVRRYQARYVQGGMAALGREEGWRRGRRRISGQRLRSIELLKSQGMSNRAVAHRLGLSEKAIRKLVGASTPAESAQLAFTGMTTVVAGAPPAAGVHRGHQISAREALATLLGIVAPLIGGWALVTAGPARTFAAVGLIQALAVLPLIGAPDVAVAVAAPGAFRAARLGLTLFLADGAFAAGYHYVWQIALFISLGESFSAYGGAMALAALVGAACGLLIGRHIDAGFGRRAVLIAYAAAVVVVLLRAASVGSPWLAVSANAAGAFSTALLMPAMMTALYNLAKASPCPLRFHIVTEGAWDIGCGGGCLIAAGLAWAGFPLSAGILLAVPAAGAAAALLCRYYDRVPAPAAADLPG